MSQVGRISGPLLQENLIRNGIDLSFETDLIYLDVNSGRVGIKTNSPSNELQNLQTTRTTNLIVDTEANFPILNFTNSTIQPFGGTNNIVLDAKHKITANRVKTDNLLFDDDRISTYTTDTNIELRPNATGITEFNNLWVENNLNVTGDVRLDGNITFGNQDTDNVTFSADVTSNIVPDANYTYNLGSASKRWQTVHTKLVNSELYNTVVANIGNVNLNLRPENLIYVSTNGDDSATGTHQQDPYRTIVYALSQASSGDTIHIMPGEYEEVCPITVPQGVTVTGIDLRNTIVKPTQATNSNNIFLLNGESSVTNLTIKDFYTGYAFSFAPSATVTSRSPYIQNITVITKGSVISASDPRGFAQGDAGKGALVDGASVLSTSKDASMLFHAVTFITPGVDALTMTNGVKVEWLNSFTYFANRGLYAVNGSTGHLSTDGSTVNYGAEIRSIGSANVYGNFGAVADGSDTLMYLIQHNMAYVGVGKYSDNDPSRVIQSQEISKLNSGNIYYQTVNHAGNFRIGDNFFIDQDTGESSIVINEGQVQGFGRLRASTNGNITIIDGEEISTGNLLFNQNTISSVTGAVNVDAFGGNINLLDNTNVTGNVDITGDLTFDGQLNLMGNQATDTLKFNVNFDQDINPNVTSSYDLGSLNKKWNGIWITEAQIDDIHIEDNFITTDLSNADLDLRANGTGNILIPNNNVQIDNDLTVSGDTNLQSLDITGNIQHVGVKNITGDVNITNLNLDGNLVSGSQIQFEEILIDGNVISTTTTDINLELRANGTGTINTSEQVQINNNLSFTDLSAPTSIITVNDNVRFDTANVTNIVIQGNKITHKPSVGLDYIRLMNETNISADTIVQNNATVNGTTDINNVTVNGNIVQTGNKTQTGNYILSGEFSNSNLYIEDNFITTTESNSDLELRANGTGDIIIDTDDIVTISNNLFVGGVLEYNGFLQINGDVNLQGNIQDGSLTITENFNVAGDLDVTGIAQFEEILIDDNFITTTTSNADLELRANGTGDILFTENTVIPNSMSSTSMDTNNIVNSSIITSNKFSTTGNNITIDDNFITTEVSNSNLELRATGDVVSQENTTIEQNLTVNGDTNLQDTNITGTTTYIGNNNQTGNLNLTGDINLSGDFSITNQPFQFEDILIDGNILTTTLSNSNLSLESNGSSVVNFGNNVKVTNNLTARNVSVTDIVINDEFALENMVSATDVQLFDNVITTSNTNSNLELRAAGTGTVDLQNVKFNENIISTLNSTIIINTTNLDIQSNSSLQIPVGNTSQRILRLADEIIDGGDADDVLTTVYDGGNATTIFGPTDLILDAGVAPVPSGNLGDIRYNSQNGLFEGFSQDLQYFGGVYSANTQTNISATTNNTIEFNVNNSLVGTLASTELTITGLDVDAIAVRNNNISITGENDLTLSPQGTGITIPNGLKFSDNIILNESATGLVISNTGFGYTKIDSTAGVVTPVGDETNKGATPQQGEIRWNTALEVQEVYNGTEWIAARGIVDNVNSSEFEEIIDFWTLVLG